MGRVKPVSILRDLGIFAVQITLENIFVIIECHRYFCCLATVYI